MKIKPIPLFFSLLFLCSSPFLFSQTKENAIKSYPVYFNARDNFVGKYNAHHYQIRPLKKEGDLYILKEYYLDGSLYVEGKTSLANYKKREGLLTTYAPNGTIISKMEYKNDEYHGLIKSFDKAGNCIASGTAERGNFINGTFLGEDEEGEYIETIKNRTITQRMYVYENYKKAKTVYFNKDTDTITVVFFDENGQEVASMLSEKYNAEFPISATKAEFSYTSDNHIKAIIGITTITNSGENKKIQTKTFEGNVLAEGVFNEKENIKTGGFYNAGTVKTYKNNSLTEIRFYKPDHTLLTEGFYKNDSLNTGTFCELSAFDDGEQGIKKTYSVSSLKDGVLDGKQIIYTSNFEPLEYTTYVNGIIEGEKMRHHRFTGEKHLVQYVAGAPFEGEDCDFKIETYHKGNLIKTVEFDFDTRKKSKVTYYNANEEITKIESIYKNKWYTIYYKNGAISEGIKVEHSGFTTYKNGKKNGYFISENDAIITEGFFKDNHYDGAFKYIRLKFNDTLQCIYKEDKPIDGVAVAEFSEGTFFTTYKKGKKHGKEVAKIDALDKEYDSIVRFYENGNKTGVHRYYKKGKLQETVAYKNNKPYNGTIYFKNNRRYTSYTFNKGVLVEQSKVSKSKQTIITIKYQDAIITEKSYRFPFSEDKFRTISYKNGKPFEGVPMLEDELKNTLTISQYKNAKKEGKEQVFFILEKNNKPTIERFYNNGKLEGEAIFRLSQSKKDSLAGTYKNGKPQDGVFLEVLYNSIMSLKYYANSELQKEEFYKPLERNKKIATISYKNGKHNNGTMYTIYGDLVLQEHYTEGEKTKTVAWNIHDTSENKIEAMHYALTDSIVSSREIFPDAVVTYKNASKNEGQMVFYVEDKKVGTLEFNDTEILKANLLYTTKYSTGYFYMNTPNEAVFKNEYPDGALSNYSKIPITLSYPKDLKNLYFFLPLINSGARENYTVNFLHKDFEKPLGTIEMRNEKPFNGEVISYYKSEGYYYLERYFYGNNIDDKVIKMKEDALEEYYKEKYNLK